MTKLTRKLFISIIAVAFAVIALATTTYAWMTLASVADVNSIEATVDADSGIEVSFTGEAGTYRRTLSYGASDFAGVKLRAITTADKGLTFKDLEDNAVTATALNKSSTGAVAASGAYVEFSIFVKIAPGSSATDIDLFIDNTVTKFASAQKSWTPDFAFTTSYGDTITTTETAAGTANQYFAVKDAARMSFAVAGASKAVFEAPAAPTSGLNSGDNKNTKGFCASTSVGSSAYYIGMTSETMPAIPTSYATITESATLTQDATTKLCTLSGQTAQEVIVRIWIEGWDGECLNALMSEKLTTAIGFSSKKAA